MGISINVRNSSQDYSYLLQSLGGSNSNLNFISEYASIKNGSYGKLMKAYYGSGKLSSTASGTASSTASGTTASSKNSNSNNVLDRILEEKRNPKVSKEAQKANTDLTAGLSSLKTSLSSLQSDKTFADTSSGLNATDKTISALKAYVSDYNNVVNAAKNSTLANKTAYVANMMSSTATNADKLSEIGITVNSNGTLSFNESSVNPNNISKVQELFSTSDIMSYGSTIGSRLQFAGSASNSDAVSDSTQTNNTAGSSAASLKADSNLLASDKLYEKIMDKDGNYQYDIDNILAAAKSFVSNYNNMFEVAESSSNSGVLANLTNIREKTAHNEDMLNLFGINVNNKGRMSLNENTFKNSDMAEVQQFFKDYGSSISINASLVNYYMTTQANASNGYTANGTYNVPDSVRYAGTV